MLRFNSFRGFIARIRQTQLSVRLLTICWLALPWSVSQAAITYDWVETGGDGASGFIRFADTNIADPANFDVFFNPENVLQVHFQFANGVSTSSTGNFDESLTLQSDPELNDNVHEIVAFNGIIDPGWTWNLGISGGPASFVDATDTDIICFVAPCTIFNVSVSFLGGAEREISEGYWQLRAVPLPPAWLLMVACLAGMHWRRPATMRSFE